MRRLGLLLSLLLIIPSACYGVTVTSTTGTVTSPAPIAYGKGIERITLSWVSSASNVDAVVSGVKGLLIAAEYVPGASTPTSLYDVTLTDDDSVDVLLGTGANLSNSSASLTDINITAGQHSPVPVLGDLTLAVRNAGASKSGTIRLFLTGG